MKQHWKWKTLLVLFFFYPFLDTTFPTFFWLFFFHLYLFALPQQNKGILQSWSEFRTVLTLLLMVTFFNELTNHLKTFDWTGCVLCRFIHHIPYCKLQAGMLQAGMLQAASWHTILQASMVDPSIKTTMDDIEWSESRRVDWNCCLQNSEYVVSIS